MAVLAKSQPPFINIFSFFFLQKSAWSLSDPIRDPIRDPSGQTFAEFTFTFKPRITILTIENLNSYSVLPDN